MKQASQQNRNQQLKQQKKKKIRKSHFPPFSFCNVEINQTAPINYFLSSSNISIEIMLITVCWNNQYIEFLNSWILVKSALCHCKKGQETRKHLCRVKRKTLWQVEQWNTDIFHIIFLCACFCSYKGLRAKTRQTLYIKVRDFISTTISP